MALIFDKVSMAILIKYFNYNNIISIKNKAKFQKYNGINYYVIELEKKNNFLNLFII